MDTLPFKFIWLGQTILKYQVPLDIFHTINAIYENNFKNMHTIRTEKIMKVDNYYKNMIPERFIKEYGHITF